MALRVLVTGANGFVGKQICQTLQLKGWNVRAMVRSSKASDQIPTEMQRVVVDTAAADIDWQAALDQVDAVVHLIAKTHSRDHNSPKARESYHRTNVELTESLLAACQKSNVRRFLYMSSIKAVGEGGGAEYTEDTRCAPGDIYGITKRIAEKAV